MLGLIEPQAQPVAGNGYGDGISQGRDLLHQDSFTWNTAHLHQFQKNGFILELLDDPVLAGPHIG